MQTFPIAVQSPGSARVGFSPDGRWLGLSLTTTPVIDSHDGTPYPLTFNARVVAVRFVPGRNAVLFNTGNSLVSLLDLDSGREQLTGFTGVLHDAAVSPDGATAFVATRANSAVCHLTALRLADMTFSAPVETPHDPHRLQLAADGNWLVAASARYLRVWRLGGGELAADEPLRIDTGTGVEDCALSPDGSQLAVATPRGVRVHETATGKELFRSGLHRLTVCSVAFAPDRPLMASGGVDGKVYFWENGRVVQKYEWGLDHAVSLAFAPDGLRCAACDYRQVVVWDI